MAAIDHLDITGAEDVLLLLTSIVSIFSTICMSGERFVSIYDFEATIQPPLHADIGSCAVDCGCFVGVLY